ncbi:class I SAM-dependent DNA methyltransferase [Helicobacter pylori]|uniref:HsdM family class I SAM-dependent methyltransferase n=1 Tax=Helicobacter pylori TaxID=210 RepID=UPI002AC4DEF5|nr:class I SAM-dependent DNA methyltransferase [Helicobacter pylori]MDZ5337571.1 class I SAM-dependent DNA methyltransferase [Helicobacter pylori]
MPNNALLQIKQDTLRLIDDLKVICKDAGLAGDGNEYKIITQCFLYKFLCDKFEFLFEQEFPNQTIRDYKDFKKEEKEDFFLTLSDKKLPKLAYNELLNYLFEKHFYDNDLHLKLDTIFNRISSNNAELFNTTSTDKTTIALFESVSQYINEESKRANFTRVLLDKLKKFNFKQAFLNLQNQQGYDFFAPIFEYLIKDYNNAGGGKYAEYYTPLSIASIIAKLLINEPTQSVKIYDPSAGTGTLLMALAHQIGTDSCTLYAQDISQKSLRMLKLNLILNDLTHSLENAIEGNTLTNPYHSKDYHGKMDFIVSNPPFKLDFSNEHAEISQNKNKKTRLRTSDIDLILETFQNKTKKADFCALVSFDEITEKNYSLNPGQYFTIEDTSEKISQAEFKNLMQQYSSELTSLFDESQSLQQEILETLGNLNYD